MKKTKGSWILTWDHPTLGELTYCTDNCWRKTPTYGTVRGCAKIWRYSGWALRKIRHKNGFFTAININSTLMVLAEAGHHDVPSPV